MRRPTSSHILFDAHHVWPRSHLVSIVSIAWCGWCLTASSTGALHSVGMPTPSLCASARRKRASPGHCCSTMSEQLRTRECILVVVVGEAG
jgi:hypothetical protein